MPPRHYADLDLEAQRVFVDTTQALAPMVQVQSALRASRGSMRWKRKPNGREYLTRRSNGGKNERSLGARDARTEQIKEAFEAEKERTKTRWKSIAEQADKQARFAVAARVNRVPLIVANLCRQLTHATHWRLVGTNCLHAYEAAAGVQIDTASLATRDVDVLWDTRSRRHTPDNRPRAALISPELDERSFIGLLRSFDKTFERVGEGVHGFRAANDKNFLVDLLRPFDRSELFDEECRASELPHDLVAQPIKGLDWLVSSPLMRQEVIDEKGYPFEMRVPDPRAFALHKLWLSAVNDRDPGKRRRDVAQAQLVASLLAEKLVNYPLDENTLRQFPADVRARIDELR